MALSQLVRLSTKQRTAHGQTLSLEQSLSMVSFLVETGIGCITYLRGMFPEENFVDDRLESPKINANSNSPGIKVKKLKRGYSSEADKILDYMEIGLQDALKHSYLKTMSFAIFLDQDQPQNIVECYTFNFSYYETEYQSENGKKTIHLPEVQVEDSLRKLNLSKLSIDNTKGGSMKTFSVIDFKRQIQNLIRNLITATQSLSELPRRRFMTFKLEYVDGTPDDYEPPMFKPLEEKYRWFMGTKSSTHLPDKIPLGRIDSKFHGVSLEVVSVSNQLENTDDDCESLGLTTGHERPIVWYIDQVCQEGNDSQPVGYLDKNGVISKLPEIVLPKIDIKADRSVKSHLKKLALPERIFSALSDLAATQPMNADNDFQPTQNSLNDDISVSSEIISVKNPSLIKRNHTDDDIMTDSFSSISSKGSLSSENQEGSNIFKGKVDGRACFHIDKEDMSCECGDPSDDLDMVCCDSCDKWVHISCHGYILPSSVPSNFHCFSCRVQNLTKKSVPSPQDESQIQAVIASLGDLALFRRAIALVWSEGIPDTMSNFAERLGVNLPTTTGIHRRLLAEGIIEKIKKFTSHSQSGRGRRRKFIIVVNKSSEVLQAKTAQYFAPSRGNEKEIFDRIPLKNDLPHEEPSFSNGVESATNQQVQNEVHIGFTRAISLQKATSLEYKKRGREESTQSPPRKKARFSVAQEIIEVYGVE